MQSVDNILKGFNKVIAKLADHAERERQKASYKNSKIVELEEEVKVHCTEAFKAEEVAVKIKTLVE